MSVKSGRGVNHSVYTRHALLLMGLKTGTAILENKVIASSSFSSPSSPSSLPSFLPTRSHCVTMVRLKLYVDQAGLDLTEVSSFLCHLSSKIKGVCHPTWHIFFVCLLNGTVFAWSIPTWLHGKMLSEN